MRIAMVGSRGVPAMLSGVERVIEKLSEGLAARGHEVIIYARPWYLRALKDVRYAGSAGVITTAGLSGKYTDAITHTFTAMCDAARRKVDVVHVHCAGPALLSFIPRLVSLPIVFTVHAPEWERARWPFLGRLALRAGLTCGMKFASAVSAVSLNLRDFLIDAYNRAVEYIPNGISPVELREADIIRRYGLEADKFGLYVGRVVQEKRVDLLIRAWQVRGIKLPLVIVGDQKQERDYASFCQQLAQKDLGIAGNKKGEIMFLGPRTGRILEELYSNAAVVILPSELEGMSLVLLEAAAYGRCIIAREMVSNREVLGDTMISFTDDSADSLGEVIERCLADKELRRRMGQAARQRVIEKFCWSDIVAKYERMYRCVLERQ